MCGAELRAGNDVQSEPYTPLEVVDIASSVRLVDYNEQQLYKIKDILKNIEKSNVGAIRIFLGNFRRKYDDPANEIDYNGVVRMLREM